MPYLPEICHTPRQLRPQLYVKGRRSGRRPWCRKEGRRPRSRFCAVRDPVPSVLGTCRPFAWLVPGHLLHSLSLATHLPSGLHGPRRPRRLRPQGPRPRVLPPNNIGSRQPVRPALPRAYPAIPHHERVYYPHRSDRPYVDIRMVAVGPNPSRGGDWFRQGGSEIGSRPWSPLHVKQGYRQIELTTTLSRASTPSLLN